MSWVLRSDDIYGRLFLNWGAKRQHVFGTKSYGSSCPLGAPWSEQRLSWCRAGEWAAVFEAVNEARLWQRQFPPERGEGWRGSDLEQENGLDTHLGVCFFYFSNEFLKALCLTCVSLSSATENVDQHRVVSVTESSRLLREQEAGISVLVVGLTGSEETVAIRKRNNGNSWKVVTKQLLWWSSRDTRGARGRQDFDGQRLR